MKKLRKILPLFVAAAIALLLVLLVACTAKPPNVLQVESMAVLDLSKTVPQPLPAQCYQIIDLVEPQKEVYGNVGYSDGTLYYFLAPELGLNQYPLSYQLFSYQTATHQKELLWEGSAKDNGHIFNLRAFNTRLYWVSAKDDSGIVCFDLENRQTTVVKTGVQASSLVSGLTQSGKWLLWNELSPEGKLQSYLLDTTTGSIRIMETQDLENSNPYVGNAVMGNTLFFIQQQEESALIMGMPLGKEQAFGLQLDTDIASFDANNGRIMWRTSFENPAYVYLYDTQQQERWLLHSPQNGRLFSTTLARDFAILTYQAFVNTKQNNIYFFALSSKKKYALFAEDYPDDRFYLPHATANGEPYLVSPEGKCIVFNAGLDALVTA